MGLLIFLPMQVVQTTIKFAQGHTIIVTAMAKRMLHLLQSGTHDFRVRRLLLKRVKFPKGRVQEAEQKMQGVGGASHGIGLKVGLAGGGFTLCICIVINIQLVTKLAHLVE